MAPLAIRRRALPIFVSVAGACLIALLVYGVSHQATSRTLDELVHRGANPAAPDASRRLPLLSAGGSRSLTSFRGKVVLLNFWASWCKPCEAEAPLLERAQSRLERLGGTVLGVTYLDATPDSQRFALRFRLSYPNLRDSTGDFAHAYGTDQLPESFLLDRTGRIVAISRGEIERPFLDRALALARSS